ncbi:MAG: choice-of-anchor D domain-containing protein [Acidobacteriota bacterium]
MSWLRLPRGYAYLVVIVLSLFSHLSGVASAQMSLSVSAVNFGTVQVGSSLITPVAVTNTGKSAVSIGQVIVSGNGYTFVGPTLPLTLSPQQSANLSISFAPQSTGALTGSMSISSSASWGGHNTTHSSTTTVTLSGTGYTVTAAPGYLSVPSSLNLGTVAVGSSQTQALAVSNSGGSSVTISGATLNGSGFTVSGLTFPYVLAAGASASLSVTFAPTTPGTNTATLALTSNASDPSVTASLTGTGNTTTTSGTLGVTPGSMIFGNVTIGTTQSQSGSLTASGGSVTLSSASSSNSAFTLGGLTLPVTLVAGQSIPFNVSFSPTTSGAVSANISFFSSSSTSSSAVETTNGSGSTVQHQVDLSWNASTSSSIAGYNIYRSISATGLYSRINSAVNPSMSYSDNTVQSGQTYYYATTAVDSAGTESAYSNQVQVAVPFP